MRYAGNTHTGHVRAQNEDSFFVPRAQTALASSFLVAVADGMGGHSAGEVASMMTIKSMESYYQAPGMAARAKTQPGETLREAVAEANGKIWMLARRSRSFYGMGTTVAAALCLEDRAVVANVGDSRVYLVSDGAIRQITRDHTLVQDLLENGVLTPEEVRTNRQRHVLTRAIGVRDSEYPDLFEVAWHAGDRLVLATDGLTEHVTDQEILSVCSETPEIEQAVDRLIRLALERGGSDNVTVCMAQHTGGDGNEG